MHSDAEEDPQPLHSPFSIESIQSVPTPHHPREQLPAPTPIVSGASAKKRKIKKGDEVEDLIVHNLQDLNNNRRVEDEDELFGQTIAATLCRFSYRQKAHAKLRIQSLLLDIEFPDEQVNYLPFPAV